MDTTKIARAARAEFSAEQSKAKSEATWRSRWWDTTLALAEPTSRLDVIDAVKIVATELGQTSNWVQSRRRTAKIVKACLEASLSDLADVRTWTPRLAVAWVVDLKRTEDGLVNAMDDAAAQEQSLREFIAAHGGIPMSTGKERFTPTPPAPAPRTHQEKVAVAREALADEAVAKEVMADAPTAIAADKARREVVVERHQARQRDRALADPKRDREDAESAERMRIINTKLELDGFIRHAKHDLTSAISRWNEIGAHFETETLLLDIDDMLNVANALRSAVVSGRTLEAELQEFLAAEGGS